MRRADEQNERGIDRQKLSAGRDAASIKSTAALSLRSPGFSMPRDDGKSKAVPDVAYGASWWADPAR